MAISNVAADAGYYKITSAKFAERTGVKTYATPIAISYTKSKTFTRPQATKIEQRANGTLVFNIPGEYTSSGKLSCAGREYALEKKLGTYAEGADAGRADIAPNGYIRGAIGYECEAYNASGLPVRIRVWEYNIEINPQAEEKLDGDQKDPNLGAYEYGYVGYGEVAEAASTTSDYLDANGCPVMLFRKISRYGDTDYSTFLDAVPAPKMPV